MEDFETRDADPAAEEQDRYAQPDYAAPQTRAIPEVGRKENVVAGIVGAFLFALLGGVLYFLIYQLGYIAGLCGLVTVVLAIFGYQLFSGKKDSLKGVVIAIVVSIVVIFLAEYLGVAYEVFKEWKELGLSFLDVVQMMPDILQIPEVLPEFLKDLAIGYFLGAIASFTSIRNAVAANKRKKELEE